MGFILFNFAQINNPFTTNEARGLECYASMLRVLIFVLHKIELNTVKKEAQCTKAIALIALKYYLVEKAEWLNTRQ